MKKTAPYVLEVENLTKVYKVDKKLTENFRETLSDLPARTAAKDNGKTVRALDGISFKLERNKVLGIIGDNGSGKTTLLKIISQITKPTSGSVKVSGKVASILEIGTGFHPDLSGRENVYLSGSIIGMNKVEIEAVYDQIVEFSGLQQFMNVQVKKYSSGMFMRLAFSVVTHLNADIVLLDEVLAVGDADFRIKSLDRIKKIAQGDRTVILVSHDLPSVMNICDQCLILDNGRVIEKGLPAEVIGDYMEHTIYKIQEGSGQQQETGGEESKGSADDDYFKKIKSSRRWDINDGPGNQAVELLELSCRPSEGSEVYPYSKVIIDCVYHKKVAEDIAPVLAVAYQYTFPSFACNPRYGNLSGDGFTTGPGVYQASCVIPSHFLHNGIFNVSVYFIEGGLNEILFLENMVSFKVNYDTSYATKYQDDGKYPGPLMPRLEWTHQLLDKG